MNNTEIKYWQNTYCYASLTKILQIGKDERGFFIIPESTIFYPGGGGQPMDIGFISTESDDLRIVGTDFNNGDIKHYLMLPEDQLKKGQEIAMRILSDSRLNSASLHTAGHWIAGIVSENLLLPFKPSKAYHYPDNPYIEFSGDVSLVNEEILDQINMAILVDRQAQLKVTSEILTRDNIGKLDHASLPENFKLNLEKPVRMVTIDTYKGIGCGGTHIDSISDIQSVKATKIYSKNGKIRVGYKVTMWEKVAS